ncbi:MAG: thiazole synthase [Pseudobdellovibrionaceae bacterium]
MSAWILDGKKLNSRLFLGTARYPSLQDLTQCIEQSQTQVVTVSLRRSRSGSDEQHLFWQSLRAMPVHLLPNTAGCKTVQEAVTTAHMAREFFNTRWIKLEVIGDDDTLQPHPFRLVEAAKILTQEGFLVFPYTTEDLIVAEELLNVGCEILMPWASPIGSGRGLMNPYLLKTLRARFPHIPMIIDAGLGKPSDACQALEMGFDAVLLNTAVSQANDPVLMAQAFASAVHSGRQAFLAGLMQQKDMAEPSTPVVGTPFWHTPNTEALL